MPESRDDYVLGIERPFPWQLITVWAAITAVFALLLFGVVVVAFYATHLL